MLNWDFKPATEPQPVPTSTIKPFITVALEAPANYLDEWRSREGIVERDLTPVQYGEELRLAAKKVEEERQEVTQRLLKKRKSDEDLGKYFYFYFKN